LELSVTRPQTGGLVMQPIQKLFEDDFVMHWNHSHV